MIGFSDKQAKKSGNSSRRGRKLLSCVLRIVLQKRSFVAEQMQRSMARRYGRQRSATPHVQFQRHALLAKPSLADE